MADIKAIFPHNCELEQFIFCMRLGQIEGKDPVVTMKRMAAPLEFGLWHDTVIICQHSEHHVYWISPLLHSFIRDPIAAKEPRAPVMSEFDQIPPGVDQ